MELCRPMILPTTLFDSWQVFLTQQSLFGTSKSAAHNVQDSNMTTGNISTWGFSCIAEKSTFPKQLLYEKLLLISGLKVVWLWYLIWILGEKKKLLFIQSERLKAELAEEWKMVNQNLDQAVNSDTNGYLSSIQNDQIANTGQIVKLSDGQCQWKGKAIKQMWIAHASPHSGGRNLLFNFS